jgi:hypothetical protein
MLNGSGLDALSEYSPGFRVAMTALGDETIYDHSD